MVSLRQKRMSDVYAENSLSNTDTDSENDYEPQMKQGRKRKSQSEDKLLNKKQMCYSKNALMARENRRRKKLYVQNLENANDKYRSKIKQMNLVMNNQANIISDMKKEISYLKSLVANQTNITNLLKTLNRSLNLPVATSIDNSLNQTSIEMSHPWEDVLLPAEELIKNITNGESSSNAEEFDPNFNQLFSDLYSPLNLEDVPLKEEFGDVYSDHNYTVSKEEDEEKLIDAGVCLHFAQQRVSLEFCSNCSSNAASNWSTDGL